MVVARLLLARSPLSPRLLSAVLLSQNPRCVRPCVALCPSASSPTIGLNPIRCRLPPLLARTACSVLSTDSLPCVCPKRLNAHSSNDENGQMPNSETKVSGSVEVLNYRTPREAGAVFVLYRRPSDVSQSKGSCTSSIQSWTRCSGKANLRSNTPGTSPHPLDSFFYGTIYSRKSILSYTN